MSLNTEISHYRQDVGTAPKPAPKKLTVDWAAKTQERASKKTEDDQPVIQQLLYTLLVVLVVSYYYLLSSCGVYVYHIWISSCVMIPRVAGSVYYFMVTFAKLTLLQSCTVF